MNRPFPRREPSRPVTAVLLDVDGTLVDSNDAHADAWVAAFAAHGRDVSVADVRDAIGKGGDKLLAQLGGVDEASAAGRAIGETRARLFAAQHLPRIAAVRGARRFVERLLAAGMRVGVATSARKDEVAALLRVAGVEDLLPTRTSADDADRSKPDPDIIQAALRALGADAASAVLVGDTPWDVEAGLRAGVRVIGVRSGGWSLRDLAGAAEVYRDVEELAEAFDDSLLGARRAVS